ncbi:MAG: glycosyltransferase family A protein, partial [Pseudomonadota bacterium]
MIDEATIGVVIIGRNEGERLVQGLNAIPDSVDRIVYVDSGSTDGSVAAARAVGAEIVELDMSQPFTAARARNAGVDLLQDAGLPDLIQFIDGDCELREGWIAHGAAFLAEHDRVAAVCGRRRERFAQASIYNQLCDWEWDTPVGVCKSCGGDALIRSKALIAVGGYDPTLIAGEEPELCVRLRQAGWQIHRLDHEMTWHDAAMTRFSQWWKRARRGGHAYAEGTAIHGAPPERHFVHQTRRAVLWGLLIPGVTLLGLFISVWSLLLLALYPLQILRLSKRLG